MKNAFRNALRTSSVILILAVSVGLSVVMLLSYTAVNQKIQNIQSSIGNQITVNPAGISGFSGGGQPLTNEQVTSLKDLPHVTLVSSSISDRLSSGIDTSLQSAIDPGSFGNRAGKFNLRVFGGDNSNNPTRTFVVPIQATGISDNSVFSGSTKLTSGSEFNPASQDNIAIVGKDLASKNSLIVGSTFNAYNTTIKVVGIFDSMNKFGNSGLYMPLITLQNLSGQQDQVTSATVTTDSINTIDTVVSEINTKLGSGNVDITTTKDQAAQAIAPLENIKTISIYSLIGSLAAGAIITLLTMVMIVRERRREIGILKAIGSSTSGIVIQFMSEALALTLLGSIAGLILGILLSNPVLNALVSSNATQAAFSPTSAPSGRGFRSAFIIGKTIGGGIQSSISNIHTSVGFSIVLYGIGIAFLIAILGSAFPSWLIANVKPADVLRSE